MCCQKLVSVLVNMVEDPGSSFYDIISYCNHFDAQLETVGMDRSEPNFQDWMVHRKNTCKTNINMWQEQILHWKILLRFYLIQWNQTESKTEHNSAKFTKKRAQVRKSLIGHIAVDIWKCQQKKSWTTLWSMCWWGRLRRDFHNSYSHQ